ncbi:MAG: type II toxin-antitoxin system VapC family toxin [Candidatus Sericytochromatia bacterium]
MIIADTGFWVALANRSDRYHAAAQQFLQNHREPLITTWPVMTETCHLLLKRLHARSMLQFMRSFEAGAFTVFALQAGHASRIHSLMEKYADLPMDLADASLLILAEELGHGRILSTDQRDFQTYRWKSHHPFANLLLTLDA